LIKKTVFILFSFVLLSTPFCQETNLIPLKTIYENNFLLGNTIDPTYMSGNYFNLLKTHFNIVTCGNDMKPDHLAPQSRGGAYRFATADNMVRKMTNNGIKIHGHVLVWHSQTHAWMTSGSPAQVRGNMVNHINTVLSHFKGKVLTWDVINEAMDDGITDPSDWRNCLRKESGWYKALGADYIELAFRTAREADPDVILYYNDYGLNDQRKAAAVRNMIKEINDKYKAEGNTRNLIDGVGMQGHYGLWLNVNDVRASLNRFVEIGIRIDISELDIESRSTNSSQWGSGRNSVMSADDERAQARLYAQLFNLFKEYSAHITRVTMWGMDDRTSWKSIGNPCLFDGRLRPKMSFYAVSNPSEYINR
jgi:endo-1,4-beta-xylanase